VIRFNFTLTEFLIAEQELNDDEKDQEMSATVYRLPVSLTGKPAEVFANAMSRDLEEVLIIGVTRGDRDLYIAGSSVGIGDQLLLIELAKRELLE